MRPDRCIVQPYARLQTCIIIQMSLCTFFKPRQVTKKLSYVMLLAGKSDLFFFSFIIFNANSRAKTKTRFINFPPLGNAAITSLRAYFQYSRMARMEQDERTYTHTHTLSHNLALLRVSELFHGACNRGHSLLSLSHHLFPCRQILDTDHTTFTSNRAQLRLRHFIPILWSRKSSTRVRLCLIFLYKFALTGKIGLFLVINIIVLKGTAQLQGLDFDSDKIRLILNHLIWQPRYKFGQGLGYDGAWQGFCMKW